MKRDSVVIYRDLFEGLKGVPERSYKRIMNAVLTYAMDGVEPNLTGLEYALFRQAKSQIDANNRKFENGKQGGRPKNQTEENENQTETKEKPNNNQSKTKENQTETKTNLNEKCKMRNEKCNLKVSKKESKEEYLNNNLPHARESYRDIFQKLAVSDLVESKLWEFIQHCNLNGKILTNDKLEDMLIRLDMKYRSDEQAKITAITEAISKGYYDVK